MVSSSHLHWIYNQPTHTEFITNGFFFPPSSVPSTKTEYLVSSPFVVSHHHRFRRLPLVSSASVRWGKATLLLLLLFLFCFLVRVYCSSKIYSNFERNLGIKIFYMIWFSDLNVIVLDFINILLSFLSGFWDFGKEYVDFVILEKKCVSSNH